MSDGSRHENEAQFRLLLAHNPRPVWVHDAETLEFPVQLSLMQGLFRANGEASRVGFPPLWAGQAVPLTRDLPAARLIEAFVAESWDRLRLISGSQSAEHHGSHQRSAG